jgi:hypothetical protein
MTVITCPRCDKVIKNFGNYAYHREVCEKTPLPEALMEEYIYNDVSLAAMAKKYDISYPSLSKRMKQAGPGRFEDARRQKKFYREVTADPPIRRCHKCGILLEHPATVDCGDKCGRCAGEVPRDLAEVMTW